MALGNATGSSGATGGIHRSSARQKAGAEVIAHQGLRDLESSMAIRDCTPIIFEDGSRALFAPCYRKIMVRVASLSQYLAVDLSEDKWELSCVRSNAPKELKERWMFGARCRSQWERRECTRGLRQCCSSTMGGALPPMRCEVQCSV